jgi:hypothetical protein
MQKTFSKAKISTMILLATLMFSVVFIAVPVKAVTGGVLTVAPSSGPAGSILTVSGGTYTAPQVKIYWSTNGFGTVTGDTVLSTVAAADMAAGVTIDTAASYMPAITAGTTYYIKASDDALTVIVAPFTVLTEAAVTLTASKTSGTVGTSVTLTGSGYTPAATISIYWDAITPAKLLTTAVADGAGALPSTVVVVPTSSKGVHAFIAYDTGANKAGQAKFTVSSGITLNPTSIPALAGATTSISGTGFTPGTIAANSITMGGIATSHAAITVAADGTFPATTVSVVAALPAGAQDVAVQGVTFAKKVMSSLAAQNPKLEYSATSGNVGTTITMYGTGFATSEANIGFTFGGNPLTITVVPGYGTQPVPGVVVADVNGAFQATFPVPTMQRGTYLLHLAAATVVPDVSFAITPKLTLAPTSGYVGNAVTMSGTGFTAGTIAANTVTLGGKSVTHAAITVAADGTLPATTFNVPAVSGGGQKLDVVVQGTTFTGAFTINPLVTAVNDIHLTNNALTETSNAGNAGDPLKILGTGFLAGETVTVKFGTNAATITSGGVPTAVGALDLRILVPEIAAGTYKINVTGTTVKNTATYATSFTINALGTTPSIVINLSAKGVMGPVEGQAPSGYVGDSITVKGTGFLAGEAVTAVTYDGTAVVSTPVAPFIANVYGVFTATFTVPLSVRGNHLIDVTATSNPSPRTYDIASKITLNPLSATVNGTVKVSGSGYATGETPVDLNWDSLITLKTVTADAKGNFTTTITVPGASAGLHVLVANSHVGDGAPFDYTATFNVRELVSMSDLLTQLQAMNATINGLKTKVDTLSASAATKTDLNTAVSSLQTAVNNAATKADVSAVSSAVSALSSTVNALQTAVNNAATKADVDAIKADVATLKSTVDSLSTKISDTNSSVTSLNTYVLIAVILAAIAAVASILTIILVYRKIAA